MKWVLALVKWVLASVKWVLAILGEMSFRKNAQEKSLRSKSFDEHTLRIFIVLFGLWFWRATIAYTSFLLGAKLHRDRGCRRFCLARRSSISLSRPTLCYFFIHRNEKVWWVFCCDIWPLQIFGENWSLGWKWLEIFVGAKSAVALPFVPSFNHNGPRSNFGGLLDGSLQFPAASVPCQRRACVVDLAQG